MIAIAFFVEGWATTEELESCYHEVVTAKYIRQRSGQMTPVLRQGVELLSISTWGVCIEVVEHALIRYAEDLDSHEQFLHAMML